MEMMMRWKDTTSYSQSDKDRKPSCWSLQGDIIRVTVLSGHLDRPGDWVMHCRSLGIDTHVLGKVSDMTEVEAKAGSLRMISAMAKAILADVDAMGDAS